MSPICDKCGQIVSEKRWRRHKRIRCQKRTMKKSMSIYEIGFTLNLRREPEKKFDLLTTPFFADYFGISATVKPAGLNEVREMIRD